MTKPTPCRRFPANTEQQQWDSQSQPRLSPGLSCCGHCHTHRRHRQTVHHHIFHPEVTRHNQQASGPMSDLAEVTECSDQEFQKP